MNLDARGLAALLIAALAACGAVDENLTGPPDQEPVTFTISDAREGGAAHFYWLPPIAPLTTYSGTFDAAAAPVVSICEWSATGCLSPIANYSIGAGADGVQLDLTKERFHVTWDVKASRIKLNAIYRIQVNVAGATLGIADATMAQPGRKGAPLNPVEYVALDRKGALEIAFRIEQTGRRPTITIPPGALNVPTGQTATFGVSAESPDPMSYQWLRNGVAIGDAIESSYTTPPVTVADEGTTFSVVVTNSIGSVTSGAASLTVSSSPVFGLGGLRAVLPSGPDDVIGVRYRFRVAQNQSQSLRLIFGANRLHTPGSPVTYLLESNIYSGRLAFADGGCTSWPLLGFYTEGQASLRHAIPDYPFAAGQQNAIGTGIRTMDPLGFPVQTYLIDNIPNLYKSDAISQVDLNGSDVLVTLERGETLQEVASFMRCGLQMLQTTYRKWTLRTEPSGVPPFLIEYVVPESSGRYITVHETMNFFSEFLHGAGAFTVQYWEFATKRESDPIWRSVSSFVTGGSYDGNGSNFGLRVVPVLGQKRIEFSNQPGNVYLGRNVAFSF
jgi:hypothetical protein